MSDSLRISVEGWLAPERGDVTDRNTTGEIKIVVGDDLVTRVEDLLSQSVRTMLVNKGQLGLERLVA